MSRGDTKALDPVALATTAQRRAADPSHSAWVSASAGSGKTKLLVDRLLRLMLAGVPPNKILCLTYTRAAAAEMRNRIDATLAGWAAADVKTLRKALDDLTPNLATTGLQEKARQLFATLLDAPGGMRIETIHAFCQSLLARFPVEAGIAPHFHVIEERDAEALRTELREEVLAEAKAGRDAALARALADITERVGSEAEFDELMQKLMMERRRLDAVVTGTGGLGAAIKRLRRRLGVKPDETLATIRRAAVAEGTFDRAGLTRAAQALAQGGVNDQKSAPDLAAWLSGDEAARLAAFESYLGCFLTGKGEPKKSVISKGAEKAFPGAEAALRTEQERLLPVLRRLKAAEIATATEALLTLGRAVLAAYAERKRAMAALDYEDLIALARDLLRRPGLAPWVLYKLDGGIDHILIDEAQDTSPDQWDIVQAIAEEFFTGAGAGDDNRKRTVFAVGDAKQSIYSFQRADPEGFQRMREYFRDKLAAVREQLVEEPLHVSFRSVPTVLAAVDTVFADPVAAAGVAPPGDETIRHVSARPGQAGRVELWPLAVEIPGEEIEEAALPVAPTEIDLPRLRLAERVAERIAQLIDREALPSRGRKVRPGDILVLVRRRNAFVDELVRALKLCRVPVAGVDRLRLGEHIAVMDLIALGQFLLMPEDDLTLAVILKSPLLGLSEEALFDLAHDRKGKSLWRVLADRAGGHADFQAAHAFLADLLARADYLPPYELYAEVLGPREGRRRFLQRLGPDAADPIEEFLRLALDYGRSHPPSLQGFLAWLEAGTIEIKRDLDQEGAGESGPGMVRIMTVHGAKGLEAPIVILPDTAQVPKQTERILWTGEAEEALPLWVRRKEFDEDVAGEARARLEAKQADEYRRLLYVALTRAADRLYLCGWKSKNQSKELVSWYKHFEASLGERGAAFVFPPQQDEPEGWEGEARLLESGQSAAPDKARATAALGRPAMPAPDWLARPARPEPLPWRPVAPSRPAIAEPALLSPLRQGEAKATRFGRGLLIHRLLQSLPEVPAARRKSAAQQLLKRSLYGLDDAARDEILARVLDLLARPELAPIWSSAARAEQPVAGEILGRGGARIAIAGQIDRFAVDDSGVWIVDFKTNRPPAASLEEVPAAYLRQMAAYRALLAGIYPGRPIACHLLWTETPLLMRLPEALLDAHLP
ncbi:MAG TPA: double-strand break repair helicase AddA [Hypericibacter adhaerens]|uniref:double-strand break repair helicase AddA n=1 Tax=Hypericibacter adhaerens TaxID=2602016 RepID=UPI002C83FF5B|nr:double-strand break repair helicase AddA [Hypericibacter adhaerens]HWA41800.1 double-strand break repair helicase AddA [Hypericibacter adhaerens]